MDIALKNYLQNLGFSVHDIKEFCKQAPGFEIIDSERAFKNIALVVAHGYPEIDIDGLIFSNPGFLCNDPDDLSKTLESLHGDIEELLKNDPFII